MNYDQTMRLIDFLNERMRPLRWDEWPNVTWAKVKRWAKKLGYEEEPQ